MHVSLKRSDTFFMMACKFSYHSFLCLGVRNEFGEDIILTDLGKRIPAAAVNNGMHYLLRGIISNHLPSEITNENRLINGRRDQVNRPISYTAIEIDYESYTQFLAYIKYINPSIYAYIPIKELDDGRVILNYLKLSDFEPKSLAIPSTVDRLKKTSHFFSYSSSCRSTIIDFANLLLPLIKDQATPLPNYFFQEFTGTTHIKNSQFTDPLFILPPMPTPHTVEPILYQGLNDCLAAGDNSEEAHETFSKLRVLYLYIKTKQNINPAAIPKYIHDWVDENQALIDYDDVERCCYHPSPIRTMVMAIEAYYNSLERTSYDQNFRP